MAVGGDAAPGSRRASRLVDIANAVGLHVSTVSRVLNGDPGLSIRPQTAERILAEARLQGYRPNALARALKRDRTGAIAFVIPLLRNPIWIRLQGGALKRASERGYVVMIMDEPMDEPKPPGTYSYLVEESRADGLLLATALRPVPQSPVPQPRAEQPLQLSKVPHVYVNRRGPDPGNDVVMDEAGAIGLFVEHVAGLGHRSILLIDGPQDVDTVHRRVLALREHGRRRGLSVVVRHAPATEEGGFEVTRSLLRGGPLPTACGVGSLNQLFGVLAALRDGGVAVPADVSVVSFDEDECLAFLDVPVTSVCMPLAELGAAAVDALIDRIDANAHPASAHQACADPAGPAPADVLVTSPMFLVPRASVAVPPVTSRKLPMTLTTELRATEPRGTEPRGTEPRGTEPRGLAGRTAVVTGTAHGIGAAIADALAGDGARVHRVDKDTADLTDSAAVRQFFTGLGPVDVLVNCAGGVCGQVGRPLEEVTDEDWHTVVNANLTTAFLCTRAVIPGMKQRRWGRVINISSAAGLTVSKTGIQAYTSAKAAQIGFTRQLAHDLGPYGITVNCIAPGFIRSNPTTERQWASYGQEGQERLIQAIATRRLGDPADIANGVQFFASDRSGWVTGQVIAIDGGSALL